MKTLIEIINIDNEPNPLQTMEWDKTKSIKNIKQKTMSNYEKIKEYLDWSSNVNNIRSIAIELLDNGNNADQIYNDWKDEIDSFLQ